MSDDDDLRDGFGAQITAALEHRSQPEIRSAAPAPAPRRAHHRRSRRRVLVGAVVIAVLGTAVGILIGRDHEKGFVRTIHPAATTTGVTNASTAPTSTSTSTSPSTANLSVTQSVHAALLAAFATHQGFPRSYVAGEIPGSVSYAYEPSTRTYWALANYSPSAEAMKAHERFAPGSPDDPLIGFQDGPFKFSRTANSEWKMVGDTGGLICPPPPESVLAVWHLAGDPDCP